MARQHYIGGEPVAEIEPGVYVTTNHILHLVVREILAHKGIEDTAANRATATDAALEIFRTRYPGADVQVREWVDEHRYRRL